MKEINPQANPEEVRGLLANLHAQSDQAEHGEMHDFIHCLVEELFFGREETLAHVDEHHRFLTGDTQQEEVAYPDWKHLMQFDPRSGEFLGYDI